MFKNYYEIQRFRFAISTDSVIIKSGLDLLYPALIAEPGPCSIEWKINQILEKKAGANCYILYENNKIISETMDAVHLLDTLEWKITTEILENLKHFIHLHASGLTMNRKAILLVGPSGAGKTSLALSLLLQGWEALSDEVLLIDKEYNKVWPLPRSFHVDLNVLKSLTGITFSDTDILFMDKSGKRRIDPAKISSDWIATPSIPKWIVFPNYSPMNRNDLILLGETEALSLLLDQTINLLNHGENGLAFLIKLIKSCQCYKLNTGDLHNAASILSSLAEQVYKPVFLREVLVTKLVMSKFHEKVV